MRKVPRLFIVLVLSLSSTLLLGQEVGPANTRSLGSPPNAVIGFSAAMDPAAMDSAAIDSALVIRPWSITTWGQHRSNTMDHELGRMLVRGGDIDRSLVESARAVQAGDIGSFGFSSGAVFNWTSSVKWRETDANICGSIQTRWIGDSRWTPELYDLVLMGNAGHLGRWDVLDGSRARTTGWLNAAIGLQGKNQNRVEIGLVYRPFQYEARIRNGYFFVNEAVDSMYASLRAEARWNQRDAWGLGMNAEWHFVREEAPFAFHVQVRNLGAVVARQRVTIEVDTTFETTGLTFEGEGWSVESIQSEKYEQTWTTLDTTRFSIQSLPTRLDVALEYPISPRSGWDVQVQVGEWMPLPRAMTGYRRAIGKQWQAGVQLIVGGWGRWRPAGWVRWREPGAHAWMLYLEDPWGWGSDSAYGRGLTLRYERL